jgi:hypothetical protein
MPPAAPAPRGDQKKNESLTVRSPASTESAARSVDASKEVKEAGLNANQSRENVPDDGPEIPNRVASPPRQQERESVTKPIETAAQPPVLAPVEEEQATYSAAGAPEWTRELAEEQYRRAVDEIGGMTSDIAGNYESLAIPAPNVLVVGLKATYNKEWCERADVKRKLEQTLARLAGRTIRIDFAVTEEASPRPAARRASGRNQVQKMREIERHPLVQEAISLFDAEIVRVDERQEA